MADDPICVSKSIEIRPGVTCDYHAPIEMRLEITFGSYVNFEDITNPLVRPKGRGVVVLKLRGDELYDVSMLRVCLEQMLLKARFSDGTLE